MGVCVPRCCRVDAEAVKQRALGNKNVPVSVQAQLVKKMQVS
jgi:hypothetical protein